MIITILGCNLGLIENAYNFRENGVLRYYLGYINLNAPIYFSYISLMYIYLRKEKINTYDVLVIAVINFYLYRNCDVRAQFYITLFTAIGAYLLKFFKTDLSTKRIKNVFVYSMPVCSIVSIGFQVFYNESNGVMSLLNEVFTGRLKLGFNAYKEYGIKLFGQSIKWVLDSDIDNGIWYSYVDSSFLKYTLMYGLVFMVIIIMGFVVISKEAVKANNIYLCFSILIIALNNMFNPHLLYIHFNIFILLFGQFFNNRNRKIKDFHLKIDTF
ncbi:hypothetical protein ACN077_07835 [Clostridium chromiireducens]|uniref:hypothetical protein n=1 Tax=Clostridium chromiireducens TaxID=225345 RepID=UPI003AF84BC0